MNDQPTSAADPELKAQSILLAASTHDIEALRTLLRRGSASVQDLETEITPLHAAIAACEDGQMSSTHLLNPTAHHSERSVTIAAAETVRLLLQNGAIWNDVDRNNETPGCMALRLGLKELYEIMVDAGVRAEILLNRLDEYESLDDDNVRDGDEGADAANRSANDDTTELSEGKGHSATEDAPLSTQSSPDEPRNEDYLQSSLRFQGDRILDEMGNGVMMAWESDIMKRTADLLCPTSGLRVLNVGHGMGIIDQFIQQKSPSTHHIIEAHPAVLARMKKHGWYEKTNVTIHEGRWQEIVPKIMERGILFDAIYFDTFAEDYKTLRDFFSDCLIGLLEDDGKWGFFNGLGADRQVCYDVYTKVVEMDLFEAGFEAEWETMHVPEMKKDEWEGIRKKYWALREYKLPICSFMG
ncbi:MAG: hypothetical protein Q9217_004488 [Psora testacea]